MMVIELEVQFHKGILDSYVPSFQQHLNIMRSTYKLQTSDFVELKNDFLQLFRKVPPRA